MHDAKKTNLWMILAIVLLSLVLAGICTLFLVSNVIIDWQVYPKNAPVLNLRGEEISVEHYQKIRAKFPNTEIYWDVPIFGTAYPEDTTELTITEISDEEMALLRYFKQLQVIHAESCEDYAQLTKLKEAYPNCQVIYTVTVDGQDCPWDAEEIQISSLTDAEVAQLDYLTELKTVNAAGCTDYAQLAALQERRPECKVNYAVVIAGQEFALDAQELTVANVQAEELQTLLPYLPDVKKVHMVDPASDSQSIFQLQEARQDIEFTWEVDICGVRATSLDTEIDISGKIPESLEQVAQAMEYLPNAEKLIMTDCGFDNETMAAFRESKRSDYKVVWTVMCGTIAVRTDDVFFHPIQEKVYYFFDEDAYNLRYCEDMIVVDVGHMALHDISWVEYMPNLKYLILCLTTVLDISPLSTCKNLIFLELDMTGISDYSPLLGCTALEDLNLGLTYGDPAPIAQMTWLKNLWWKGRGGATFRMLKEALPNTNMNFTSLTTSGGGWRKLQNYYDMRDIMGMYYM